MPAPKAGQSASRWPLSRCEGGWTWSGSWLPSSATNRYVMDYLLEEVLDRQPAEVSDFLLKTSVLERLCGPLCDSLIGSDSSQRILKRLENSNLFIAPLDEVGKWYRYHHLFADLLRHQLEATGGMQEMRRLHHTASEWFEHNNLPGEAIRHALEAEDWGHAVQLIEKEADGLAKRGEWNTLYEWFRVLPAEALRARPRLYGQFVNALLTHGDLEAAEVVFKELETAEQADSTLGSDVAFFQCLIAFRRGDILRFPAIAERALDSIPDDAFGIRARVSFMLGFVEFGLGNLNRAEPLMVESAHAARLAGDYWIGGTATAYLGEIMTLRGKLSEAISYSREATDEAGHSPTGAVPQRVLATILYERNHLEEAATSARMAVELSQLGGHADVRMRAYYYLAQKYLIEGDLSAACMQMKAGDESHRHPTASMVGRPVHAANRITFCVQCNDLEGAEFWAKELAKYPSRSSWLLTSHTLPRLLIAKGEKRAAAALLQAFHDQSVQVGAMGCAIKALVYQSIAAEAQAEALEYLGEALARGEPEGFVRTFVDEGKLLAPLLRKARTDGVMSQYATKLLKHHRERRTPAQDQSR